MNRIKQLPKNVINQIAAGEVIERPASVVKELVENSIDAGASKIEISISNECRNVRVADNGCGIHPDDIELAFTKHATSKLTDENGLFDINTLGFRGEALASMISVAKVTCTTRTQEFEYGTKADAMDSQVSFSQIGCAVGTVIEVNDLFYNQSARLKFLKNQRTEFTYIQEYIQALAISHPKIGFILKNNNTNVINTTPGCDLAERIVQIYPSDILNELKEVRKEDELSQIKISGYISLPNYTRSSKKSIYTFVNSRVVKCPTIMKAIDTAYKNMLPIGRYPFAVLNIEIPPSDVDVNAHPAKREVRYKNTNQIFSFTASAVEYALLMRRDDDLPKSNETNKAVSIPFLRDNDGENFYKKPVYINTNKAGGKDEKTEEKAQPKQTSMNINFNETKKKNDIVVIGQYQNTYILVENPTTLEIIDQHIADERYIYETLKKQKKIVSQLLIVSDVIDIDTQDAAILANAREHLADFGYQIEKISDNQIIFKKIPQILSKVPPEEILAELLKNLEMSPENDLDSIEERILIATSCKAAIKAGEKLTLWQMEDIVKKLRTTKNPYTCPHGRPITHYIPLKEIASYFLRNN